MGGAYLKNWDQRISVVPRMIGHADVEDIRLLGGGGLVACSPGENCQSYHHNVNLYHFKSFTIPSGGPFWLLGGVHTPRTTAPAYAPAGSKQFLLVLHSVK